MGGAAVTIALEKLKWLFGIKDFIEKTDIVSVMRSVINSTHPGVSRLFVSSYLWKNISYTHEFESESITHFFPK